MKSDNKRFLDIVLRYLFLVLVSLIGIKLFHYLFFPLTIYPSYWALNIFYSPILLGDKIFIGTETIEIIGACVAGSAYLFLLMLNFATPKIKMEKRLKLILFSFGTFLIINLIRIILLAHLFLDKFSSFEFFHQMFWYLGSTVFVVGIWFFGVLHYKIYEIPFYSDLKFMISRSLFKKYFKK